MKKALLTVALLLSGTISFSQTPKFEAPNYTKIESNIKDKKSDYYYPNLLEKFNASDSTMTLEQKRHLFYGFVFQEKYSPYNFSDHSKSLGTLINKENLTNQDFEKILELSDLILQENPFDLRTLNYKSYSLSKLNKKAELKKNEIKTNIIMEVLFSSGDGTSKESAFYVINTSNEYDLINMIGFQFGGEQSLIEHYDYLKLAENKYNIPGFYFDITPCLNHLNKKGFK
ncbi:DUF4919 domain-containing protein [Flavobacterium poyangense]|uniref:DUF4919 domain-containing protein n=1 Tax=Flavobacterium poyangense TaxID=2204302 RepID=UPI00141E056A|nr:DUF4919 domain-containing protein [Flavobacterium sp. JXAS1]